MRWAWWRREDKVPPDAHAVVEAAEQDVSRRLSEARRLRELALAEAAKQRELRHRNRFGEMIIDSMRARKT